MMKMDEWDALDLVLGYTFAHVEKKSMRTNDMNCLHTKNDKAYSFSLSVYLFIYLFNDLGICLFISFYYLFIHSFIYVLARQIWFIKIGKDSKKIVRMTLLYLK